MSCKKDTLINKKKFGASFERLMRQRRLSDSDLVSMLDLKYSAIWHYRRGLVFPRIETLIRLAEILGCTTDELLGIK